MNRLAFATAILLVSPLARADHPSSSSHTMKSECHSALKERIHREHKHARDIDLSQDREWQESKSETGIEGEGTYIGEDGKKRHFGWDCIYDTRRGHVVRVTHDKPSKHK